MKQENIQLEEIVQLKKEFEEKEKEYQRKFWADAQITQLDDLMRFNYGKTIEEFTKIVLDFVADLTNAFSGIMYITEKNTLQAMAAYACTLEQLPKKHFKFGEDAVGQVAKSCKPLIYENVMPESRLIALHNFKLQPATLVLMPFVFNDKTYGVVELVYLHLLEEKYFVFLEKIGKNIAIMIESISNTSFTKKLLQESQGQAEQLQAQEEELRQNNEELMTTQEELQRRGMEMNAQFSAINKGLIAKIEFSRQGLIEFANDSFCKLFGYEVDEINGKHHSILVHETYASSSEYTTFLDQMLNGAIQAVEIKRKAKNGDEIWLNACYSPVLDNEGNIIKIIKLAFDTTQAKKQQTEIEILVKKLQAQEEELRMNLEALQNTQEELEQQNSVLEAKEKELQQLVSEMQVNEEDMQNTEKKFRETIKNFQLQSKEMKQQKELIAKLELEINLLKSNQ